LFVVTPKSRAFINQHFLTFNFLIVMIIIFYGHILFQEDVSNLIITLGVIFIFTPPKQLKRRYKTKGRFYRLAINGDIIPCRSTLEIFQNNINIDGILS
jgi:hypothetical protein